MVDEGFAALNHVIDRRRLLTGPDHLDVRHNVVVNHRQVDLLERIPAGGTFAVAQRLEIKEGMVRPFNGKTEVMECKAGTIDAVAHELLTAFAVPALRTAVRAKLTTVREATFIWFLVRHREGR